MLIFSYIDSLDRQRYNFAIWSRGGDFLLLCVQVGLSYIESFLGTELLKKLCLVFNSISVCVELMLPMCVLFAGSSFWLGFNVS
jgi:hypothetical protein